MDTDKILGTIFSHNTTEQNATPDAGVAGQTNPAPGKNSPHPHLNSVAISNEAKNSEEIVTHETSPQVLKGEVIEFKDGYHPAVIGELQKFFFAAEKSRVVTETMTWKNGEIREIQKVIPNPPPMLSEFARKIGVTTRTLKKWAKENPDFRVALEQAQEIIKEFLIANGLTRGYDGSFAKFVATNETDMKDKSIIEKRHVDINKALDQIEKAGSPFEEYDA